MNLEGLVPETEVVIFFFNEESVSEMYKSC